MQESNWMGDDSRPKSKWFISLSSLGMSSCSKKTTDLRPRFPSQNCHPSSLVLQRKHGYHCWGLSGRQGWTAELDITQTGSLKPLLRLLVEDGWPFPHMEVQISLVRFSLLLKGSYIVMNTMLSSPPDLLLSRSL